MKQPAQSTREWASGIMTDAAARDFPLRSRLTDASAFDVFNGDFETFKNLIYYLFAALGVSLFIFLKWFYRTRFGAAINAMPTAKNDRRARNAMVWIGG